jgi:isopentenyl diphosphate isomerase/L-lactate dehydrogenase-like FMN-dependent dehydrogenase
MEQIFDILKEPVAALLTLGVIAIISLVCAKLGIDLKWIKDIRTRDRIKNLILEAEEWGARRWLLGDETVTGAQKLQYVLDRASMPEIEAKILVDQELPKLNLGASRNLQKTKDLLKEGKLKLPVESGESKESLSQ